MMMMRVLFLVGVSLFGVVLVAPKSVQADGVPLSVDLAEDFVNITTGFGGAHLVVFGTKQKRGDLAVVLRGPEKTAVVRQKNKVFGLWMNTESFKFRDIPSYYDFALSMPDDARMDEKTLALMAEHKIGASPAFFAHKSGDDPDVERFQAALLRTEQDKKFYPREAKDIRLLNEHLFRVEFYLPPSVPKGEYEIVSYLMDGGRLIDQQRLVLDVKQVGFNSTVNKVAYRYSFGYGCLCVFMALVSGWGINALRRGF